ncbi:unnamed protein product [Protopolystoma xenopodis]|uniref:BCS1 N-terminal domain-containing protein n=1 Tax=Protopolystoma xenopodis TaxID=117903 RepID=A0A448WTR3_9PLAT|nr:unnamed protein product [Protopolystoma xenopodis]
MDMLFSKQSHLANVADESVSGPLSLLYSGLKENPYFSAGAGLFGMGLGAAAVRRFAQLTQLLVRRNFTLTLEVASHDTAYPWVLHWLSVMAHRSSNSRFAKAAGQHLAVQTNVIRTEGGRIRAQFDFIPSTGIHYFIHAKRIIRVERVRSDQTLQGASMAPFESVTLTTFGRDASIFQNILKDAREAAMSKHDGWTVIYKAVGPEWRQFGYPRPRRPISSVVLHKGISEAIVKDVKEFIGRLTFFVLTLKTLFKLDNQQWYTQRGIPYRRGYLLHGPPGCGKSSFITALAGNVADINFYNNKI